MRILALNGADLVLVPTAKAGFKNPVEFEPVMQVQSLLNGVFAGLCNRSGLDSPEMTFLGGSFFTDPHGQISRGDGRWASTPVLDRKALSADEQVVVANLDMREIEMARRKRAFLRDRRPHTYTRLIDPRGWVKQ